MLLEETFKMDDVSLQQIINQIPQIEYRYRGSFPSDYFSTLDNDFFAILDTQPSNMQGEHNIDCKLLSNNVFYRLFWEQKVQFP